MKERIIIHRSWMAGYLRWIFLSVLCGIMAGTAAAFFLFALAEVTRWRLHNPTILWGLPIAGFMIGWVYHRFGQNVEGGHALILGEIAHPSKALSLRMAPFILVGTLVTHLFGGSAGREGTAVQMGASLADQLSRVFKISARERRVLLIAGSGAGFGAAIGAPWAGWIFGFEISRGTGSWRFRHWFECLVASVVSHYTAIVLHAPHSVFGSVLLPTFDLSTVVLVVLVGAIFGLAARGFMFTTHLVERAMQSGIGYPPLKPLLGGVLLVVIYVLIGNDRYVGLGLPYIQQALMRQAELIDPLFKAICTAITVGSGFKGGEFIPLVFTGTTLGSALSALIPLPGSFLGALGFAAVFGAASKAPVTCAIMAIEIFGIEIAPYAFLACLTAVSFSGPLAIYQPRRDKNK